MDASKKQREPVAFKSLAELKRFIRPGVEFKTVSHANHTDMVGLTRVVTTVQTVGFYSKIKDQPEHPFSTCNHGKGFYTDFGKAGKYIFDGTTVKVKDSRKQDRGVIYELEFYDREHNMEETMMDRKMVNFIREQYPPGTRIRLNSMDDPYAPILPGTEGEVDFVDDKGQIFMKWDNGRTLPLAPGEDSFTVLPPKLTTLKLYMPLTADLYERNEYGDLDDSSTLLEGRELRGYQDQITAALVKNRMPEEAERGLMHWYDEVDSVNTKVRTAVFTVEERDRQLWGVAECRVAGELSDTELETIERPKIVAAIAEARDKGDLSENAEYDAAKEAQGLLEMKINKLKQVIADAKIIDESKLKTDSVQILNKVELKNVKNGMKMTYTIVSESEANLKEGKISVNTPIAQGLLGKKVGDVAEIKVPQGIINLEVVNISF